MNKKKNKKRRIRLSFIGGRRPAFLDQGKTIETKKDTIIPETNENEIEPIKDTIDDQVGEDEIENNVQVDNKKDKAIENDLQNKDTQNETLSISTRPRPLDKRRKSLEALENATVKATEKHLEEMETVTKEVKAELQKWQQLMSDDLFEMFGKTESQFMESSTSCVVLNQCNELLDAKEGLVEMHMKLTLKSMKISYLHEELKLKHELLETAMNQFCEDSCLDLTANKTGAETPRHLIKKIVSLK